MSSRRRPSLTVAVLACVVGAAVCGATWALAGPTPKDLLEPFPVGTVAEPTRVKCGPDPLGTRAQRCYRVVTLRSLQVETVEQFSNRLADIYRARGFQLLLAQDPLGGPMWIGRAPRCGPMLYVATTDQPLTMPGFGDGVAGLNGLNSGVGGFGDQGIGDPGIGEVGTDSTTTGPVPSAPVGSPPRPGASPVKGATTTTTTAPVVTVPTTPVTVSGDAEGAGLNKAPGGVRRQIPASSTTTTSTLPSSPSSLPTVSTPVFPPVTQAAPAAIDNRLHVLVDQNNDLPAVNC